MNAQISFLEGTYTLIHIPLGLYPSLLQPILRVLLPQTQSLNASVSPLETTSEGLTADAQHGFLNISVTPIECSVVCHSSWAANVFEPVVRSLPREAARTISTSRDTYHILSVISAGLDAAGRVMELTSPLALAGIPIFFIATYYSDFILVPSKERRNVILALASRGFEFSENEHSFVSPAAAAAAAASSSSSSLHSRNPSRSSTPPATPPPSTVAEMQSRTFELLKRRSVVPYIEGSLALVQCSGRETSQLDGGGGVGRGGGGGFDGRPSLRRQATGADARRSWLDNVDTKLYTSIISALISQPRFLSVTLTQDDPPSLLLDRDLLAIFGNALVGDTNAEFVPLFLDLVDLPFEATGIVCGVAGRLVQEMKTSESSQLSYLSTARAGAVIMSSEQAARALEILKPLLTKEP